MSRQHIYVRPMRMYDPAEVDACEKALTDSNAYIPENSFSWPSNRVLVAEKGGVPVLFQPIRTVYLMGSLGKVEGFSRTDLASAQHQITAAMVYESHKAGYGELLFMGGHKDTEAFAVRHQFEHYPHAIFRLKVLDAA